MQQVTRAGLFFGLGAYIWWGLVPLYFAWLGKYPPLEFVAHRILWSALFLGLTVTLTRRWPEAIRCLVTPKRVAPLAVSAIFVAANWLCYVLCVENNVIVQASLGYFLLPLFNVALGLIVFRERLRPLQYLAIALALVGVSLLTAAYGAVPWLALGLAVSFAIYGVIRKQVPVDGLTGLTVETIVLLPITLVYLTFNYAEKAALEAPLLLFKLSVSGMVTAVPLLCFGEAARRLPFTTLGFMQYIAPSLQFVLAIALFEELVQDWRGYGCVWLALAAFSIDTYQTFRKRDHPATTLPAAEMPTKSAGV